MSSKLKNILILVVIALVLILVYFLFIKKAPEQPSLVPSANNTGVVATTPQTEEGNPSLTKEFLTLLLNVKGIKINDQILSDPAFSSLRDSTIDIVDDGTEGRSNPFAPVGSDLVATPPATPSATPPTAPPATPSVTP